MVKVGTGGSNINPLAYADQRSANVPIVPFKVRPTVKHKKYALGTQVILQNATDPAQEGEIYQFSKVDSNGDAVWTQINDAGGGIPLPVDVPSGGTGQTTLTDNELLVGDGVSPVGSIANGTTGQVLTAQTGADPVFSTLVVPPIPVDVPSGGTGQTTLTDNELLVGDGVSPVGSIANGTTGQVLTAQTGADPVFSTPTQVPLPQIYNSLSTGILTGGIVTVNGGDPSLFDVSAGTGYVVDNYTDPLNPILTNVSFGPFLAQTVTNIATDLATFIGIDIAGAIVQQTTDFTEEQRRDIITLTILRHPAFSIIIGIGPNYNFVPDIQAQVEDLAFVLGDINISGNIFSENGANLQIDKSAGETFRYGANFPTSKKNPNTVTDGNLVGLTFNYFYRDGSGGTTAIPLQTLIDPNQYDDGSGTLDNVPFGRWTIQHITFFTVSNFVVVEYGQDTYLNQAAAEEAINTEFFESNITQGSFRCWLVVERGTTDLTNAVFKTAGKFGNTGGGGGSSQAVPFPQIYNSLSTGILTGGVVTINGGNPALFDVSAGTGYVVDNYTDPAAPTLTEVSFGPFLAQTVTSIATDPFTALGIDSAGAIVQQITTFTEGQRRDLITLSTLSHTDFTTITDIGPNYNFIPDIQVQMEDLTDAVGDINVNGNIFSDNGANLQLSKSSGQTFKYGANFPNSKKNPNNVADGTLAPVTFNYTYQDGSGGVTIIPTQTLIDPDQYDDGTGTLASVPNNRWTIQHITFFSVSNFVTVQYGQNIYMTQADALDAIDVESFNSIITTGSFRCWLVVVEGETDLSTTNTVFKAAGKFGDVGGSGGGGGSITFIPPTPWTPVAVGSTFAGVGTYTIQEGSYTVLGKSVTATWSISWTGHTGTGDVNITGLPLTPAAGSLSWPSAAMTFGISLSWPVTHEVPFYRLNSGDPVLYGEVIGAGQGAIVPIVFSANVAHPGNMICTITYFID